MGKRKKPLQSRSRERVELIIKAARALAIETEISEITTSLIATRAGVPVGSIYQYFEDKNDVLLALGEELMEEQDQKLQTIFEDVSAHAHWRHVVRVVQHAFIKTTMEDSLFQRLSKSLSWTKEWAEIHQRSTNKMVDFFSNYGLLTEKGLSATEARNTVRIIVTMTGAVVRTALELPTEEERKHLLEELPKMTTAYLSTILGD
jgi:AcrR family transcriptional regulator